MTTAIQKQQNIFRAKNYRERLAKLVAMEVRNFASEKASNDFIEDRLNAGLACARHGVPGGYEVVVYGYAS
jgi:hypothetical protein